MPSSEKQERIQGRFSATIEYIRRGAAVVDVFGPDGEWMAGGRVEIRSDDRASLREAGRKYAALTALGHGGVLESFATALSDAEREACPHRCAAPMLRRPANALNVEIGAPLPRCNRKQPTHWPSGTSSLRWFGSGGSALVFGPCSALCPEERS